MTSDFSRAHDEHERARHCVTHHDACDCGKARHLAEIARLTAERDAARLSLSIALAELHNIANTRSHTWTKDVQNQFEPWAQSRARHAISLAANPMPEAP